MGGSKINILILSWRGPGHPHAGGAEIVTHEYAKAWVRVGHKVTLFTSTYPGAKSDELLDGVQIIRRGRQVFGVQLKAILWYLFENRDEFNLVIDQFHGIPFFTPIYIRNKKLAFIHEVAKNVWGLNPWPWPLSLIPAVLGPILEPLIFKIFYKKIPFLVVSESTKDDLVDWGIPQKNIYIIHNGVNIIKPKNTKKEKKFTITYLGALSKDKGIDYAIDAFNYLNARGKFNFWVIGMGSKEHFESLRKKSQALGLNIKFWGYVDEKTKFELLARSHLLINPSVREGWGLVVIEAASMGTPTVGFYVPGIKDSVVDGKTGLLARDLSTKDLAENIIKLIKDEALYSRLQKKCIERSKNFTWEKATNLSLRLIDKIV